MIPVFENMSGSPDPYADLQVPIPDAVAVDRFIPGPLVEKKPSPYFPSLSEYHGYKNFSVTGSDSRYIVESWYFSDETELKKGESFLYPFLIKNGNLTREIVDLAAMENPLKRQIPNTSASSRYSYAMTRYESNATSGYFLIAGLNRSLYHGYYITYYGTTAPSGLPEQSPHLRLLMLTRYNVVLNNADILEFNPF